MDEICRMNARQRISEQLPVCDVCNRPVERLTRERNWEGLDEYNVYCHGARERFTVDPVLLADADVITIGRAFQTRRLGSPEGSSDG